MTFSSQHHSFDIAIAAQYGIEEAILIHHFQHWIRINRGAKRNIKEGRCWTYQTRKEIKLHFPYWTFDRVRRLCEKLVDLGVLITGNFNKNKIDKTLWYAFVDEKAFQVDETFSKNLYERQNCPSKGNSAISKGKIATPIPDTITDTITENKREREREREAQAPPPTQHSVNFYEGKFENRVHISPEFRQRLIQKFGSEELVDQYAEKLYRWSYDNEKEFKKRKRHDLTIETWMERDGIKIVQAKKMPVGSEKNAFSEILRCKTKEQNCAENKVWYKEKIRKSNWRFIESKTLDESDPNMLSIKTKDGKIVTICYNDPNFKKDLSWMLNNL